MATPEKYSKPRVLLHWSFAVVIIWASISGFGVSLVQLPPSVVSAIHGLNVSLTALLVPLFLVRLVFSWLHPGPSLPTAFTARYRRLIQAGHIVLYIVIAQVLVSGVLMMDRPIEIFGLLSIRQPLQEPALIELFNTSHRYGCAVLALLVLGHIGAVLLHALRGHNLLARMSPRAKTAS